MLFYMAHQKMTEASKWFDVVLKEFVEPVRGKFKRNEPNWREESMIMMNKLVPQENVAIFSQDGY